jgi:predicted DsbA family dithiol-disulfide isomerase
MLHIHTSADFACPACYLANPRIDQAIAASRYGHHRRPLHRPGGRLAIPGTATASAYADAINQGLTAGA